MTTIKNVLISVCSAFLSMTAHADLFKCTVGGKVQYQETPCAGGEEKALNDSNRRMRQQEREALQRVRQAEDKALSATQGLSTSIQEARREQAEQSARAYLDRVLIDPSSAQYRNMTVYLDVPGSKLRTTGSRTTPLVDVVCGEVNSRNRMGGYVGFKYFYWDTDEKKAVGISGDSKWDDLYQPLVRDKCAKLG